MIRGFYSAMLGMQASQTKLDTLANNIANSETIGFKSQTANFSDTLYSSIDGTVQTGSGVRPTETAISFAQGIKAHTGNDYDFAIEGNGFFAVSDKNGAVSYTRSGNFSVSEEDGKKFLVMGQGQYILDGKLNKIEITPDSGKPVLGVFDFPNPYALQMIGDCKYAQTQLSGQPKPAGDAIVINGSLEASTVDMISEMAKMIEAQRAFQFNSKMIQITDEIEHTANTLK